MINVAVLGYGTVGSGVVEVIEGNHAEVGRNAGEELHVKYILDLRDFPGDPYEAKLVHDFDIILNDSEVSIVCEVMGGAGAAYRFTRQALEAGKSVCTSNKELVAKHGPELLAIAARNRCSYLFEASVGGGIPIIRAMNNSLTADKIEEITGILNGTTNYILTKLQDDPRADYCQALKQAQELGYAERNPEADVEGRDACRKIAILSSLMTGKNVDSESIYTEGITKIAREDFDYAMQEGMTIKLLAVSRTREDGSVLVMVAPFMICARNPLAMVNDVFNGVLVKGNMLGEAMFYGRGAGRFPTASAVAADVVDCARNQGRTLPCVWGQEEASLADLAQTERRFFVRSRIGARAAVEESFPGGRGVALPEDGDSFGYFTPMLKEEEFDAKCKELGAQIINRIRLL